MRCHDSPKHPGIPMRGWLGLVITVAFMAVMMLAVPALRWFFVLSIPPGLAIAGIIHLLNRRRDLQGHDGRAVPHDDLDEPPGIRIHKIPVKSWAGLLFAAGVMTLFLVALPEVRWFFVLTLPAGLLVGAALYLLHRR